MTGRGGTLLVIGGVLNLGVALAHVAIPFFGAPAYRYFGAGEEMAAWAEQGSPLPGIITFGLAIVFAVFGLYAFSAAGTIRRLPPLTPSVLAVGGIYTLRGGLGVPAAILMPDKSTPVAANVAFSLVALAIGLLYLVGYAMVRDQLITASPDRREAPSREVELD
jgi:hypothetical protein